MTRKVASDGRKDDDPEGMRKVRPARAVDIPKPFGLGTYLVSVREYGSFIREAHRQVEAGCHIQFEGVWIRDERKDWQHPGFVQSETDPVVCVSWEDAQDYIVWLNTKARTFSLDNVPDPYRLPTWEEIEYATRAGTTTVYYWGDAAWHDRANYGRSQCLPCGPVREGADRWLFTSPVGSFPSNPWGLYDMAGNVWQWVDSCRVDPKAIPPRLCRVEVLHGGSWLTNPEYLETGASGTAAPKHRNNTIGFRIARTLKAPRP